MKVERYKRPCQQQYVVTTGERNEINHFTMRMKRKRKLKCLSKEEKEEGEGERKR